MGNNDARRWTVLAVLLMVPIGISRELWYAPELGLHYGDITYNTLFLLVFAAVSVMVHYLYLSRAHALWKAGDGEWSGAILRGYLVTLVLIAAIGLLTLLPYGGRLNPLLSPDHRAYAWSLQKSASLICMLAVLFPLGVLQAKFGFSAWKEGPGRQKSYMIQLFITAGIALLAGLIPFLVLAAMWLGISMSMQG